MSDTFLFDDLIQTTGYRLCTFELYNWGTFDNHIVHLDLKGENSLLTGGNGSGKTTIVDALLTLIVPSEYVSYNISSGKDGKDGRSMDSYVRGAWSTHKEDDQSSASRDYLRDTSTHSILLGTFANAGAQNPVTLLQIHYYSQSGTLQHVYAIFDQAVTIRELQQLAGVFNPSNYRPYKAALLEHFGQDLQFFDTFKSYSKVFSERVGFRSREKALKIFSKTVGMKDLTNLNEFIRTHMLDEVDFESEYRNLNESYENLHNTQMEIEKDDEQIRQLTRILQEGERFGHCSLTYSELQQDLILCDIWKSWQAKQYMEGELDKLRARHSLLDSDLIERQLSQESLETQRQDLRDQLNQNERFRQLEAKRESLYRKQMLLQDRQSNREYYANRARFIGLEIPFEEAGFEANQFSLASRQNSYDDKLESLQENIGVSQSTKTELLKQLEATNEQLISLAGRDSNIPLEYLKERKKLCSWLRIEEQDLPFAGELLQVDEQFEAQRKAIELVLHDFALTLLIPLSLRNKVTQYLWANQVHVPLAYVTIPQEQFLPSEDDDENFLCNMVITKEGHPFSSWVLSHVQQAFRYFNAQDLEEYLSNEKAFCERNLVKDGSSYLARPIPLKASDIYILGWDTAHKREQLVADKDNLAILIQDMDRAIKEDTREIALVRQRQEALIELRTINSYMSIDTMSAQAQVQELEDEIQLLEAGMEDFDLLRKQMNKVEATIKELKAQRETLLVERGKVDAKTEQYEATIQLRTRQLEGTDVTQQQYDQFSQTYSLATIWANLDSLDEATDIVRKELERKIQIAADGMNDSKDKCINYMSSFCKPSSDTLIKYPTWTSNLLELGTHGFSMQDIPQFREVFDRLVQDDLPKHKQEFSNYRTNLIGKDVISFNRRLMNWQRMIDENIVDLNTSLQRIDYSKEHTHIRIRKQNNSDDLVRKFKNLLKAAMPASGDSSLTEVQKSDLQDSFFTSVQALLQFLRQDDIRTKVLDVRRWFLFAAEEYDLQTGNQLRYYQDSAGISGGQKAKLAYTIFAAAIAKQFDVFSEEGATRSFRFVLIDEAFSKIDDENSRYAMQLFSQLNLQLMVITPLDKGNLVLPFIKSVQVTECPDGRHSQVVSVQIDEFELQ